MVDQSTKEYKIMKFTKKDLRAPHECFTDKCETVNLTRGDIALLNQVIALLNLTVHDERYRQLTSQISLILETEKITPGAASLIFKVPAMFKKHVMEFSEEMAAKQQDYYGKNPDKKPLNPMNRFLTKEEQRKLIKEGESDNISDTHQSVEPTDESETQQSVDAKSTQQVEQTKVEPQPE